MTGEMERDTASPRSGRLSETPLPSLLLELLAGSFSGRLLLTRGRIAKSLEWRGGWIVLAESSRPSETLSAFLRDTGRISQEAAAKLLQQTRSRRGREVEGVRELRLLPPRELLTAVSEHARQCALEVFAWPEGGFRIEPARAAVGAPRVGVDPIPLVQEGIETHWGVERILLTFAEHQAAIAIPTPEVRALERRLLRDPGTQELLEDVTRPRPLGLLLQGAATPRALAAAWVLLASGALGLEEPTEARESEPDDPAPLEFEIRVRDRRAGAAPAGPAVAPASGSGRAEDEAAVLLRGDIEARHEALESLDHYALLDLEREASSAEVRRAYMRAAKRFHPDAVARHGLDDLKQQANEIFARVARAHAVLSNPGRRSEYDASRGDDEQAEANRLAQAEMLYRKAQVLLRAGRFVEAVELLEPCVSLWPEEALYHSELAWALFKQPRADLARARIHLETALGLDGNDARAHYRLSLVLAGLNETQAAERARATAQRLDPSVVPRG